MLRQDRNVCVTVWQDSWPTTFMSSGHCPDQTRVVQRKRDGTGLDVDCSLCIVDYNSYMVGVDTGDQYRKYHVRVKSRRLIGDYNSCKRKSVTRTVIHHDLVCNAFQLVLCIFVIRGEMMTALLNTMQGIIFSPRRLRPELVFFGVCPLCVLFLCFLVFFLCSFRPYLHFHHYACFSCNHFTTMFCMHHTMHISCAIYTLTLRNPPSEQRENSYQPSL